MGLCERALGAFPGEDQLAADHLRGRDPVFLLVDDAEYYTFPVYFPLLLLTAGALAGEEARYSSKWLTAGQVFWWGIGVAAAVALGYGLWSSRNLPSGSDIGALLAHRDVAGYTLSMALV